MGYVLVKADPQSTQSIAGPMATTSGFVMGLQSPEGFLDKFPAEKLREKYGVPVKDDKGKETGEYEYEPGYGTEAVDGGIADAARRGHRRANYARYGIAGLAAMNALYNQTSSGQAGVLAPTIGGAYTGFAGSQGLGGWGAELSAAKEKRRLDDMYEGLSESAIAPNESNTSATPIAPPTNETSDNPVENALNEEYGNPMDNPVIASLMQEKRRQGGYIQ